MGSKRAAILVALVVVFPFAGAQANSLPLPPPGAVSQMAPPPNAGPIVNRPPVVAGRPQVPPTVRLQRLEKRERRLKRHIWRLRMRRRQFMAQGMPNRAHRAHERILDLGWRLRRVETAERALRGG
ncbi:MAG: hypothetical protein ACYDEV_08570 [Acidiferrobacter sp.]